MGGRDESIAGRGDVTAMLKDLDCFYFLHNCELWIHKISVFQVLLVLEAKAVTMSLSRSMVVQLIDEDEALG